MVSFPQNHLSSNLTAGVGCGFDVEIPFSAQNGCGLSWSKRGLTLQWAPDWHFERERAICVGANHGRAMKVACCGRPAQTRKRRLPAQQQGVFIQHRVGNTRCRGGHRRHLIQSCHLGAEGGHVGVGLQRAAAGQGDDNSDDAEPIANANRAAHFFQKTVHSAIDPGSRKFRKDARRRKLRVDGLHLTAALDDASIIQLRLAVQMTCFCLLALLIWGTIFPNFAKSSIRR